MQLVDLHRAQPVGGRVSLFIPNWERITSDPWVLSAIQGYRLEFSSTPLPQSGGAQPHLGSQKDGIVTDEISKLAQKGAITEVPEDREGFVSPIFVVPKSDGSWRPVINLQALNQHITKCHFKMESIKSVKGLVQKEDWLAKLDLKDAYLSVPIHPTHQRFLRFRWKNCLWQFKVLPFGLSSAPCTFTKIMKPVVAMLRKLGIRVVLYLDDMLVLSRCESTAKSHVQIAMNLLSSLGFIINMDKSVISPAQQLEFLGFRLDSCSMMISLPARKLSALRKSARQLLAKENMSVRELSQILGTMVASHPAILPAPLHYRHLERSKTLYLRKGYSYDQTIPIHHSVRSDLYWWTEQVNSFNGRPLQIPSWDLTLEADASMMGWGAYCQGQRAGGPWTAQERSHHINYLELTAAFLALQSFCSTNKGVAVLLRLDNVTAISFLNRMGGVTLSSFQT